MPGAVIKALCVGGGRSLLGWSWLCLVLLFPDMLRRLYDQFVVLNEAILSAPKIDYGTKLD